MFHNNKELSPYLLLTLAAAIWGIATPVIKYTVGYVPPMTFLAIRFLIAGIVLLPYTIHTLKTTKINLKRGKHLFILSISTNILTLGLVFIALSKTSAIEGAVISSLTPLLVTLLGGIILKEVIRKHEIEGLLIALVGTFLIIFEPLVSGESITNLAKVSFEGNLLFAIAVLIDAASTIYLKKHISQDKIITPFKYIALTYTITAILFIPLGAFEQLSLYRKSVTSEYPNLKDCTINDYDVGAYAKNTKCDSKGCYKIQIDSNSYFCKSKPVASSFGNFVSNNLASYITTNTLLGILYMALFSGIIAYTFYAFGMKHLPASEASIFYYLQPLFGIPLAVLLLGENATLLFAIGAVLIIFGIIKAEHKEAKNMLK